MKDRLKIGFDAKRLFLNNTGLGNYSRTLVRNLQALYPEHEYHLFTPKASETEATADFLNGNFHIHTCPNWMPASYWRTFRIGKHVDKLGLDLYHGLSHELPITNTKAKQVVTFHDLIYEILPDTFSKIDTTLYKAKYRRAAEKADHIISISNSTSDDLQSYYQVTNNKLTTIYQSCHPSFHDGGRAHDGNYILYVGSINERKGLKQIIKAYSLLDPKDRMTCVVIGNGGTYLDECHQLISELDLSSSFDFKGNVPNHQLVTYYDDALATILPSQYEGFGIPVIESLYRFTPVITSNRSSLPEAAGPGAILVDPQDPQSITEAIRQMTSNSSYRSRLALKGSAYVNDQFAPKKLTHQLMSSYRSILAQ